GRCPAKIAAEPGQVAALVDVVPCLGEPDAEAALGGARQERTEGAPGAEPVGVEEPGVCACRADEVVAAVLRRSDHEVVAVEQREGAREGPGRKMGRVPVEGDHAPAAIAGGEREDGSEARGGPRGPLPAPPQVEPT